MEDTHAERELAAIRVGALHAGRAGPCSPGVVAPSWDRAPGCSPGLCYCSQVQLAGEGAHRPTRTSAHPHAGSPSHRGHLSRGLFAPVPERETWIGPCIGLLGPPSRDIPQTWGDDINKCIRRSPHLCLLSYLGFLLIFLRNSLCFALCSFNRNDGERTNN